MKGIISDKLFKGHRSPVAMALYFLEAIRSGARGINDLTNYVETITVTNLVYNASGVLRSSLATEFSTAPGTPLPRFLANGGQIVSLLTLKKYVPQGGGNIGVNVVVARVRAINGVAVEKRKQSLNPSQDFVFRYQLRSEVIPFVASTNLPFTTANGVLNPRLYDLTNNLYDLRLTLAWPLYQQGSGDWQLGSSRKTLRTLMAGRIAQGSGSLFEPSAYSSR
jgi:hypothetical protein